MGKVAVNCPICAGPAQRLLDLPRFPITEKYEPWTPDFLPGRYVVNQSFHFCSACSHGFLGTVVPDLYGADYRTTTGRSDGATQAVKNFHAFIKESVLFTQAPTVIDIGANDYTLLNMFTAGEHKVAIDKCVNGVGIEDANLSLFAGDLKLIISSHTIEHLPDPAVMIRKCAEIMTEHDVLALQFPSLELLVEDARIDQIHHQHIHYFSRRSIAKLLAQHGLVITSSRFDPTHWGAVQVMAHRGTISATYDKISEMAVRRAISAFKDDVYGVPLMPRGAIALGAALMLPVLAYWMPQLENVAMIADDDKAKDGMRYVNFNKPIRCEYDLKDKDVVITAIGSKLAMRALTKKAIDQGARRVFLPLHTL